MTHEYSPTPLVRQAGSLSLYDIFNETASRRPDARSLVDRTQAYTYRQTHDRVTAIAAALLDRGIRQGDRIAVLAENCIGYIELHLAAARLGAIVACQNWRLTPQEIRQCLELVSPSLLVYSSRFVDTADALLQDVPLDSVCLQVGIDSWVKKSRDAVAPPEIDAESGLLILYTSGTTGPAKAALISQRALIARMNLLRTDLDVTRDDGFIAWSPMFHMGGSEHSLSTLLIGGTVFVADGFDVDYIAQVIGKEKLGWLLLVPATIDRLIDALDCQDVTPVGVKRVGAMADLIPKKQLARISARLNSPFLNTFGATETGIAPASGHAIPAGVEPEKLSKQLNSNCAFRLVDDAGNDVPAGNVGEAAVKGPTLFSGYWGDEKANAKDFFDGWFRMGDLFTQNADGSLDFYGRAKYLIKSGGENIYPVEIETILLADHRVLEAVVVSSRDEKWGEVPVAVIATDQAHDSGLLEDLLAACRAQLASYKCPKEILVIPLEKLGRNTSGKVVRNELERMLKVEGMIN